MSGRVSEQHGRNGYTRGCRCDVCRAGQRDYIAAQRARRRGIEPRALAMVEPVETPAAPPEPSVSGACVAAVRADVERLGVASERVLVAAAEAMARILDDPRQVTTQPSACGKLLAIMSELHKSAMPPRGRLAVVQEMSLRPDAR